MRDGHFIHEKLKDFRPESYLVLTRNKPEWNAEQSSCLKCNEWEKNCDWEWWVWFSVEYSV